MAWLPGSRRCGGRLGSLKQGIPPDPSRMGVDGGGATDGLPLQDPRFITCS
ncbi:hypothetical protein CYA_2784 [Synechococcus sp. JA-3-3Ab]|nr:hypothetical protein CYA_2784 [Synechococcus sp. JA-3-3Ab]